MMSCTRKPSACITYDDYYDVELGEDIYLGDCSHNAHSYQWNMGDGTIYTDRGVIHRYDSAGVYNVSLTVYSKGDLQSAVSYQQVEIHESLANKLKGEWKFVRSAGITYMSGYVSNSFDSTMAGSITFGAETLEIINEESAMPLVYSWTKRNNDHIQINSMYPVWEVEFVDEDGYPSQDHVRLTEQGFDSVYDGHRRRYYLEK